MFETAYINKNNKVCTCWIAKRKMKRTSNGGYKLDKGKPVWYFRYMAIKGFGLASWKAFNTKKEALDYQAKFLAKKDSYNLPRRILAKTVSHEEI